ncbi:MAG: hypothetical protein OXG39_03050 [Chloroflexi bacterium]|nr:hypothetical protein [Chloroflexota bacterium]
MSESTDALLRRAHELIENDQHEQAQEVLAPLLETESSNPALWWVYAHAVTDSEIGVAALDRVLDLDPTYPGARELKAEVLSAQDLLASDLDADLEVASAPSSLVDEDDIDDWESIRPAVDDASANPRTGRGFVLIIAALLILASGAVLVLSGAIDIDDILSLFGQPTTEPIIVVAAPTAEATATELPPQPEATDTPAVAPSAIPQTAAGETASEVTAEPSTETEAETDATASPTPSATSLPATAEPTMIVTAAPTLSATDLATVVDFVGEEISDIPIDAERSSSRVTQLGMTLDIFTCAEPGPEFNARLQAVMNAAARVSDRLPAQVQAFAVSLLNCADENASVRTIGVARSVLDDFAAEAIDDKAFQRAWHNLA